MPLYHWMFSGKPGASLMACKVQVWTCSSAVSILGSSDVVAHISIRDDASLDPSLCPLERVSIVLFGNFSLYHSSAGVLPVVPHITSAIKEGYVTVILDKSFPGCCFLSRSHRRCCQSTLWWGCEGGLSNCLLSYLLPFGCPICMVLFSSHSSLSLALFMLYSYSISSAFTVPSSYLEWPCLFLFSATDHPSPRHHHYHLRHLCLLILLLYIFLSI
jgi:hypothetical protein